MVSVAQTQLLVHVGASLKYAHGHKLSFNHGVVLTLWSPSNKGKCRESPSLTTATQLSWSRWYHIHYRFFSCGKRFPRPLHTELPLIHTKIRGSTLGRPPKPSLEGHKDLKHSGSLRYKGTIASTHNSLKLYGLTLTAHKEWIIMVSILTLGMILIH